MKRLIEVEELLGELRVSPADKNIYHRIILLLDDYIYEEDKRREKAKDIICLIDNYSGLDAPYGNHIEEVKINSIIEIMEG